MKNFLLSLLLLAAVLAFVLIDSHFVRSEIAAMESLLTRPGGGAAVSERLQKDELLLSLSANHLLWEQALQSALDLSVLEATPSPEADAARAKLRLALSELESGEKCTISGLL